MVRTWSTPARLPTGSPQAARDYIARRLAIDWLTYPERGALGVYTLTERVQRASTWIATHEPSLTR